MLEQEPALDEQLRAIAGRAGPWAADDDQRRAAVRNAHHPCGERQSGSPYGSTVQISTIDFFEPSLIDQRRLPMATACVTFFTPHWLTMKSFTFFARSPRYQIVLSSLRIGDPSTSEHRVRSSRNFMISAEFKCCERRLVAGGRLRAPDANGTTTSRAYRARVGRCYRACPFLGRDVRHRSIR